ncbi:MAG: helix-turn-helix transcriptional regulator [Lachnospiraceae bacterium]
MKINRMLEIIIYLMNHERVSARQLAERFQVSIRTIQRDMISISAAGIPVYTTGGKCGGYSVLPTYKMRNSDIRDDEQQMIIKALESLATSYKSDALNSLIEKYNAIIEKEGGQKVFWDFSVTRENRQVQDKNHTLEQAITDKKYISFTYRNADGEWSQQYVEPLAIHYKWYAWYLFGYKEERQEYRTYKVARIQELQIQTRSSGIRHGDVAKLMKDSEQNYYKTCIDIEVHFDKAETGLIEEFFPDCPVKGLTESRCRIVIHVPAKERLWKALLLSFGSRVEVVAPDYYRDELIQTAQKFLSNYDI